MANQTMARLLAQKRAHSEQAQQKQTDFPEAAPQPEPEEDTHAQTLQASEAEETAADNIPAAADELLSDDKAPVSAEDDSASAPELSGETAEDDLAAEIGEAWDYLDESIQQALLKVAERNRRNDPKIIVEKALSERDAKQRQQRFLADMDKAAQSSIGIAFSEVVNQESFSRWLKESRKRNAIFSDAALHQDSEAKDNLLELLQEYHRQAKPSRRGGPALSSPQNQAPTGAKKTISEAQYRQAIKDKRLAGRRQKANETIARYLAQQQAQQE